MSDDLVQYGQKSVAKAMQAVAESREIQEVQAAMTVAKRFPRDQVAAVDRIINACTRRALAETALYSYNRGGQEVTGPSIRLAEVLAQGWGNLQTGVRELSQEGGESIVEAFAWDLETNTRDSKVFTVPHIRATKAGNKVLTDPRDIYEMVANVGARRKRACILSVIPGDVVELAVNQCETTMAASASTDTESVLKMLEIFDGFGVSKQQIEARLGNRVDAIRPAQMMSLRKIYQSLRDGISAPEDWFSPTSDVESAMKREPEPVTQEQAAPPGILLDSRGVPWISGIHAPSQAKNTDGSWRRTRNVGAEEQERREKAAVAALKREMGKHKPVEPEPEPAPQNAEEAPSRKSGTPAFDFAFFRDAIENAVDLDDLDNAEDVLQNCTDTLEEGQFKILTMMLEKARGKLQG